MAVGGRGGQDFLDVLEEAQVEHFVGLVEDDGANAGQVEEAMLHQIDEPAGSSHDDLGPLFQRLLLGLVSAPPVHLDDPQAPPGRGGAQLFGHLLGELARGQDDQALRLAAGLNGDGLPPLLVDSGGVFQHRNAEAERFARSGLGLPDDVVSPEGDGQGERLYGEGAGDALVLQRLDNRRRDAEIGENGRGKIGPRGGDVGGGFVCCGYVHPGRIDDAGALAHAFPFSARLEALSAVGR